MPKPQYVPIRSAPRIVAELLPGRTVSMPTVYSWMNGLRGKRLKTKMIGGRRYCTRDWVAEFMFGDDVDSFPSEPRAEDPPCT